MQSQVQNTANCGQLWQLWCRTPFGPSKDFQEQSRLRRDVVRMKRELAAISAQDDFARWAKLRRQHDKAMEEHDKKGAYYRQLGLTTLLTRTGAAVTTARSNFDSKATIFRWTCTSGVKFALQFWHAKTPVYTYPRQWLPWPVEFALGFPRCPYGGVSINVWSNSCAIVFALIGELVTYAGRYVQEIRSRQPQKIAMGAKKSQ